MNTFFQLVNILPFLVLDKHFPGYSTYGETSEKDQHTGQAKFTTKLIYYMIRHIPLDKRSSLIHETKISNINLKFKTSNKINKQAFRQSDKLTMTHIISKPGILST